MAGLETSLNKADHVVAERLAETRWHWAWLDPEIRRALGRLSQRLGEIRRFADGRTGPEADEVAELLGMLDGDALDRLDVLWAVHDRLGQILMRWATPEFLAVRIAAERLRPDAEAARSGSWPPSVNAIFDDMNRRDIEVTGTVKREVLSFHNGEYAAKILHQQARERTRSRLLLLLAPVVAAQTVALGFAIAAATNLDGETLAATAIAGAVGALLAGIRQVRDTAQGLAGLRSSRAVVIVQPLIGASLAMLVALALEAGVLGVDLPEDGRTSVLVAYGFIAGFSEPFAIGLISRVTGGGVASK